MEIDIYRALAQVAREQMIDHGSGLDAYIEADDNTGISPSRLRKLKAGGAFTIRPVEEDFHLIGFLDCIAWMARNGYIDFKKVREESDIDTYADVDSPEWGDDFAKYITTDAAMLFEYCSDVICEDMDLSE